MRTLVLRVRRRRPPAPRTGCWSATSVPAGRWRSPSRAARPMPTTSARTAFVAAIERIDDCREPARFGGWLLQIVRNRARNLLRDQRSPRRGAARLTRRPAGLSPGGGARAAASSGPAARGRARGSCPRRSARWSCCTTSRAGSTRRSRERLELPAGTVRSHLHHARRRLRQILSREETEPMNEPEPVDLTPLDPAARSDRWSRLDRRDPPPGGRRAAPAGARPVRGRGRLGPTDPRRRRGRCCCSSAPPTSRGRRPAVRGPPRPAGSRTLRSPRSPMGTHPPAPSSYRPSARARADDEPGRAGRPCWSCWRSFWRAGLPGCCWRTSWTTSTGPCFTGTATDAAGTIRWTTTPRRRFSNGWDSPREQLEAADRVLDQREDRLEATGKGRFRRSRR